MRSSTFIAACLLTSCASSESTSDTRAIGRQAELSFAAISDIHVEPRWRDQPQIPIEKERGAATFAWLVRVLHEPQSLPAIDLEAAAPQIALVCGDITEFGAIDDTWSAVERLLDSLNLPWFAAAGNHDLTWAPVFEGFEKRFGGLVYSFDRGGAHFIALCSASPCEPLPSFSPLQLDWLRADLARNADRKPVFVFMHHPPDSAELAPSQVRELRAAFDGHDIAALFFGHGHQVEYRSVAGLDCVQCGSTFASSKPEAGDARGYALASIAAGKLRVAYRYLDPAKEPRILLEKTLRFRPRAPLSILEPVAGAPAREQDLTIVVRSPDNAPLVFMLDGEERILDWRLERDAWRAKLPLAGLAGGAHQIAVGCDDDGASRLSTRVFIARSEQVEMRWRRKFAGSLRAAPVFVRPSADSGEMRVAVATTAGEVAVLDPDTGELVWTSQTAAVLGSPLACDDGGIVVGTTEGWIEAFDSAGAPRWRYQLGKPVLAGLAGDGEMIFAADAGGCVHALELSNGTRRWKFEGARGPVEARPLIDGGRVIFGAWDGFVRTLDSMSGELLWATTGASSEKSAGSRYYSPADVAPVAAGGAIWIADRGGVLSRFDRDGRRSDSSLPEVASVSSARDGKALDVRTKNHWLHRLNGQGEPLWRRSVPMGRVPAPSAEAGGRVAVVSDLGLVNLIDAADQTVLWSWRATADGYVFAAPLVAADGTVWVAAMDGSLSCLRAR